MTPQSFPADLSIPALIEAAWPFLAGMLVVIALNLGLLGPAIPKATGPSSV